MFEKSFVDVNNIITTNSKIINRSLYIILLLCTNASKKHDNNIAMIYVEYILLINVKHHLSIFNEYYNI